jgi:hypothetical protein
MELIQGMSLIALQAPKPQVPVAGVALVGIGILLSLVAFVMFIIAVVKMFQANDSTMGIVCLVLTVCTGLGPLIGLIVSWMKAKQYGLSSGFLMGWTLAFILGGVLIVGGYVAIGVAMVNDPAFQQEFQMEFEQFDQLNQIGPALRWN